MSTPIGVVTGYTAEHMQEIEDSTVVGGLVDGDNLHLTTRDGTDIDAGNVRGPKGDKGDTGAVGPQGPGNATDVDVSNFVKTLGSLTQTEVDNRVRLARVVTDWNNEVKTGPVAMDPNAEVAALHAPGAHNYVGQVIADPSGACTQIAWRNTTNVAANMEIWMRNRSGAPLAWSPWVQLFQETGVIRSGIIQDMSGKDLVSQGCQIKNGVAYVIAAITLPAIANSVTGDIGNVNVANVVDSRFLPVSAFGAYGHSGVNGRVAHYYMSPSGQIAITALGGTSNINAGESNGFTFQYPVV